MLAVADGVGGWNKRGVDPSIFSNELIKNVRKYWEKNMNRQIVDPKQLIKSASKDTKNIGSSTLVLVTIDPKQALLRSAYIGDSGYVIYRLYSNFNSSTFKIK